MENYLAETIARHHVDIEKLKNSIAAPAGAHQTTAQTTSADLKDIDTIIGKLAALRSFAIAEALREFEYTSGDCSEIISLNNSIYELRHIAQSIKEGN